MRGMNGLAGVDMMQAASSLAFKVPHDKASFKGWLVGGWRKLEGEYYQDFLSLYGIAIEEHWNMERSSCPERVPKGTEIALIMTDAMSHSLGNSAIEAAKKAGVVHVRINRNRTSWTRPLLLAGFPTPPPWRKNFFGSATKDKPMQKREAFSVALRRIREAEGLSRRELSSMLEISEHALALNEQGHSQPRRETYESLCKLWPELRYAIAPLSRAGTHYAVPPLPITAPPVPTVVQSSGDTQHQTQETAPAAATPTLERLPFHAALQRYRLTHGITTRAMAEKVGLLPTSLSTVLNGNTGVGRAVFYRALEAYPELRDQCTPPQHGRARKPYEFPPLPEKPAAPAPVVVVVPPPAPYVPRTAPEVVRASIERAIADGDIERPILSEHVDLSPPVDVAPVDVAPVAAPVAATATVDELGVQYARALQRRARLAAELKTADEEIQRIHDTLSVWVQK